MTGNAAASAGARRPSDQRPATLHLSARTHHHKAANRPSLQSAKGNPSAQSASADLARLSL
ncbi:hypothetical protein EMIT0P100_20710 [Pseudomonas sp. IT-P100]